jgi:nucleoid-associated protein YgaU
MIRYVAVLAVMFAVAGCEKIDTRREAMETAQKRVKVGAYNEAIASYESALDGSAKSAEVHYKIAMLYDDKLKQPVSAVHHYERYLVLAPTGPHAKEAKVAKADCERRLEVRSGKDGLMSQVEALKLRTRNERIEGENKSLAQDNKVLLKTIKDLGGTSPLVPKTEKPVHPQGTTEYTVMAGDTLASIAQKVYKNRALAGHLKDANSVQLGGKDIIFPGQVLIIPDRPAR